MVIIQWFGILGYLATVVLIVELIRRRRLKEKYALLWLLFSLIFIVICLRMDLVALLARAIGFQLTSNMLLFCGLLFCLGLILSLTVIVSVLSSRQRALARLVGLQAFEIERLRDGTPSGS